MGRRGKWGGGNGEESRGWEWRRAEEGNREERKGEGMRREEERG